MLSNPAHSGWRSIGPRLWQTPEGRVYEFPPTHPVHLVNQIDMIESKIDLLIKLYRKGAHTMHAEIQALAAVLAPLVEMASKIEAEVAAQTVTISALQAKVASGVALDADDVAALADAATKIAAVTSGLGAAVQPVAAAASAVAVAAPPAPAVVADPAPAPTA